MQGYMVYAWDQYYPTTADKQVKGVFLDEVKAEALKRNLRHQVITTTLNASLYLLLNKLSANFNNEA